jgi:tetratricopeptide (TPR) repeat protein
LRHAELTGSRDDASRTARRAIGWALAGALVLAGVAAAEYFNGRPGAVELAPIEPDTIVAGYGPATFAEALAQADANVSAKRYLLQGEPHSWLWMEGLARALLSRARLTADASDLKAANDLLDDAVAGADWPSGPMLSRAGAALIVHDLAGVDAALARFDAGVVPSSPLETAEAQGMRCEVAFERGDLAGAVRLCTTNGTLGIDLRRANLALASGDPAIAAGIVESALRQPLQTPYQLCALMLQRTAIALATGDWQAAGKWARAADRRFPGYWLAEAFVAQSMALEGDVAGAEAAYRKIAERTGNPDVYGALVVLAEERSDSAAVQRYLAEARKGWDTRVALLPDTYASHFAEHLALSGEIDRALKVAGGDYQRRPYLQPMTDFSFVLDMANRPERIVEIVEHGERAGFRSASLLLAKADALKALGRPDEAAKSRKEALVINSRVEHPRQAFVHFRQD